MRIALARFDATVGDLPGNARKMVESSVLLAKAGADCIAFGELSLCGYPPRDLLGREGFVATCERLLVDMAAQLAEAGAGEAAVLIGTPLLATHEKGSQPPIASFTNSVALLRRGKIEQIYRKRLLPDYDVFDEPRFFAPGNAPCVFDCNGTRVGLLICEDLWRAQDALASGHSYHSDPLLETVAAGAQVVVCPSASPFARGKYLRHQAILQAASKRAGVAICSINASGANDDLIFDGGAEVVWPHGKVMTVPRFTGDSLMCELGDSRGQGLPLDDSESLVEAAGKDAEQYEVWHALVTGISAYFRKTGHQRSALGISGGIDSALVAALATAALGGDRVMGVLMPSEFSSEGSRLDAIDLARRCSMPTMEISIAPVHAALREHLHPNFVASGQAFQGLTDENLQSRLRGLQMMAWSNASGALVLSTGNKSEFAVGYATLYGDMCGAIAPIGDLLKTDVWELARWANRNFRAIGFSCAPIPESSVTKAPSAELRPDQTDQDSLPPYEILDRIVRGWVEEERSVDAISRTHGLEQALVARWTRAIDLAEYKRRQAPVILRVSGRAFGPGRRMPVVANDQR